MDRLLELTAQAEAEHFWFRGFRRFLIPVIGDLARGRRDLTLIDCGCGTGSNLRMLDRCGRTFGFDLAARGASRASGASGLNGQGRASGADGRIVQADVLHIPFGRDTFDIATSFDVLQSVKADALAVREMTRVVRPGGAVVLTVAALEMLRGDHAEAWGEVRRYTPSTARVLVEQAGLRVERIAFLFGSIFPLMLAVRMSQRLLRPFRGPRDDTDIRVPSTFVNRFLTLIVQAEAAVAPRLPMPVGSSLLVVAKKPNV